MKSYEIIGYTFDADIRCIACAVEYVRTLHKLDPDDIGHSHYVGFLGWTPERVWGCVEFTDSEGNDLHPIFASDYGDLVTEDADGKQFPPRCGDCGEELI